MRSQIEIASTSHYSPSVFEFEEELEGFLGLDRLPGFFGGSVRRTTEIARATAAIANGNRDENKLASGIFFDRHPERNRRKIARSERAAAREWLDIRDRIVRPLLSRMPLPGGSTSAPAAGGPVSGTMRFKSAKWGGWKGLSSVPSLARIRPGSVTDTFGVAIAATSGVEGAFDKVQTYDRGILSWGIKQWTLHAGSLQNLLGFIQKRLADKGQTALWNQLFPGVSIRSGKDLWFNGRPYTSNLDLRRLIRKNTSKVEFDRSHMIRWMRRFVIAGRHPAIQEAQLEYAKKRLRDRLNQLPRRAYRSGKRWKFKARADMQTIGHYLGSDGRNLAFFQSMVTQNPGFAMTLVATTVDKMRQRHGEESAWPISWRDEFRRLYEKEFSESGVACWGKRAKSKGHCRERTSRYRKTVNSLAKFNRP